MSYSKATLPPIKLIALSDEPVNQVHSPGNASKVKSLISNDARWERVAEFLQSSKFSANSRKLYERELKRFLTWMELPYAELRPRHVEQYKEYLLTDVRTENNKPLSKNSINAGLATIKSFCKWLTCNYPEMMVNNPALGIKLEKISLSSVQSLSNEQIQQVWTAINLLGETKQRDTVLVHILSHGLRASEVVNLNIGAFEGKVLRLVDAKNEESRLVPLQEVSQTVIADYLRSRTDEGEELTSLSPLLISHHNSHKGERLSYHGVYFAVEKIGEMAGINHLHPHAFRHTYATNLLLLGIDPTHVRQLTGHQSEKGFRRYMQTTNAQEVAISAYYRATSGK